jgi:hypothetical protein
VFLVKKYQPTLEMAKPFFNDDWESLSQEELSRARARLSGFTEATPDTEKLLREVSKF